GAELPGAARVVGGAEHEGNLPLARPCGEPRGRGRKGLAGGGDRRADPPHPRATRRHGAHPFFRARASRQPRRHLDGASEGRLGRAGGAAREMTRARARWAIFAFALGVRFAAIYWNGSNVVSFGDAPDYLATANSVCRDHLYPDRGNLPFFRAPLLPF